MVSLEPYAVKGWREVIVLRSLQDQSYSGPRGWVYSKYICSAVLITRRSEPYSGTGKTRSGAGSMSCVIFISKFGALVS